MLAIVVAVVWRRREIERAHRRTEAELASPDPEVRSSTLRRIGNSGLRRWAPPLMRRIEQGVDDSTAEQIAWLVAANQWEPADDPGVAWLRRWSIDRERDRDGTSAVAADHAKPELVSVVEEILGSAVTELHFEPARR